MDTLIRAKLIIDGTGSEPKSDSFLLIRDEKILAVGKEAKKKATKNIRKLDFSQFVLLPGLIDSHVHLIWSGCKNTLFSAINKSEILLTIQAVANMKEALQAGITTVRDYGSL